MKNLLKRNIKNLVSPFPYRYYFLRKKIIFIHIPKAAGTSVLNLLGNHSSRDHATWYEYSVADIERFKSYHKFTVVRNPFDRLVSTYRYLMRGGNQSSDMRWKETVFSNCESFDQFVEKYINEDFIYRSRMFWPQHMFLFNEFGDLMVDDVLKFESLSRDWIGLSERVGLSPHLKKLNSSSGNSADIVLSSQVMGTIFSVYRRDFELLGYEKRLDTQGLS